MWFCSFSTIWHNQNIVQEHSNIPLCFLLIILLLHFFVGDFHCWKNNSKFPYGYSTLLNIQTVVECCCLDSTKSFFCYSNISNLCATVPGVPIMMSMMAMFICCNFLVLFIQFFFYFQIYSPVCKDKFLYFTLWWPDIVGFGDQFKFWFPTIFF